jgi:hypothetical protein
MVDVCVCVEARMRRKEEEEEGGSGQSHTGTDDTHTIKWRHQHLLPLLVRLLFGCVRNGMFGLSLCLCV